MKVVLQRVLHASVAVNDQIIGKIGKGYLLLLGVENDDTVEVTYKMADKICKLRIFQDDQGKTNLSLADIGGEILVVSQFTLYADCRKGNRPSFIKSGAPELANHLYEQMIRRLKESGYKVEQGSFGEEMKVELLNDGPFTLILNSRELGMEEQ